MKYGKCIIAKVNGKQCMRDRLEGYTICEFHKGMLDDIQRRKLETMPSFPRKPIEMPSNEAHHVSTLAVVLTYYLPDATLGALRRTLENPGDAKSLLHCLTIASKEWHKKPSGPDLVANANNKG